MTAGTERKARRERDPGEWGKIREKEEEPDMKITEEIMYVGVNDHEVELFEGQYLVPNGMAYNHM